MKWIPNLRGHPLSGATTTDESSPPMASLATRLEQLIKETSDRRCSDRVPGENSSELRRETRPQDSPVRITASRRYRSYRYRLITYYLKDVTEVASSWKVSSTSTGITPSTRLKLWRAPSLATPASITCYR